MEKSLDIESILSFLRGGNAIDVRGIAKTNPETLARAITYMMMGKYHRQNMVRALLSLINDAPSSYKGAGWELLQRLPISYLLEITNVLDKKDNTKRLRHAIVTKLATTDEDDLIRAFFMGPTAFRMLFETLYIPRDKFNDKPIVNESYQLAHELSKSSITNLMYEKKLGFGYLLKKLNLPFERVKDLIKTPADAEEIATNSRSDTFFEHARLFRNTLGDDVFNKIAIEKMKGVTKAFEFMEKRKHLEDTGALTPKLIEYMEEQSRRLVEEVMKKYDLESLALFVDVSGSMHVAVDITKRLYDIFSKTSNVTDIIAFNDKPKIVTADELPHLPINGGTSIGCSVVSLVQRFEQRGKTNIPQALILVSDLEENTRPYLYDTVKLLSEYNDPPLIVVQCKSRESYPSLNYPHAIIQVDDFHKGLAMEIMEKIAMLTSKVAVKEKKMTTIVKQRRPIEEELGLIELPVRPPKTCKKGYLEGLLCHPS